MKVIENMVTMPVDRTANYRTQSFERDGRDQFAGGRPIQSDTVPAGDLKIKQYRLVRPAELYLGHPVLSDSDRELECWSLRHRCHAFNTRDDQIKPNSRIRFRNGSDLECEVVLCIQRQTLARNNKHVDIAELHAPFTHQQLILTEAIGRLVLDDYSATLFSSSPATFAAIDAEVARGHQLADAIERIAFPANP